MAGESHGINFPFTKIRHVRPIWLWPLLFCVMMGFYTALSSFNGYSKPVKKCCMVPGEIPRSVEVVDNSLDLWSRQNVQTCTAWKAPIIWNKMFKSEIYSQHHKGLGTSVALTVFAVGRYLDVYLRDFILSAEEHFMIGLKVDYYIFTDAPDDVPKLHLGPGRTMTVMLVQKHKRWQDICMMRMETIGKVIDTHISSRNHYIFCMDVDQIFVGPFGPEALGNSVALLHAYYYKRSLSEFTYDRNPKSEAYMKDEDGDYYYHAAVFGGAWQNVKNMTASCLQGIMKDKKNGVEALWHDESHLNKYFWLHKPSKVLSPEYCWAREIGYTPDIQVQRLVWAEKNYGELRDRK